MRKYLQVTSVYLRSELVWRTDTFMTMVFSITKIIFAYLLWGAIFSGKSQIGGFTLQGMLSYYIISSFLAQLDKSAKVSLELNTSIRNGTFSKYMVMPIRLQTYFLSMELGSIIFYLGFDLVSTLVWIVVFRIQFVFTSDPIMIAAAVLMIVIGLYFMLQLNIYLGILSLRYQEIGTFLMIKNNLIALVTGGIVPLILFPQSVLRVFQYLPFYYVTYLPSMLLTGNCESEVYRGILIIAIWAIIFRVLNEFVYQKYRIQFDGAGI